MLPTVVDLLARRIIGDLRLLQKYITVIFFIVQNLADGLDAPDIATSRSFYLRFKNKDSTVQFDCSDESLLV